VALAVALARWKPRSLFGFVWFALFLLPVSNIVPIGVVMAERYLYVPAAGLAIALAFALDGWLTPMRERWAAPLLTVGFVAAGVSFATLTWGRNAVWETPVGFWDDACHCAPESASMFLNLGIEQLERGRLDPAERALRHADELAQIGTFHDVRFGTLPRAKAYLGVLEGERGNLDSAVVLLREAVRLNPRVAFSHVNLGVSLSRQGKLEEAENEFRVAIAAEPYDIDAKLRLATMLVKAGHPELALAECDSVLARDRTNAQALEMRNRLAAGR
jgi:tetratricopeptide (TPR) repeat protein